MVLLRYLAIRALDCVANVLWRAEHCDTCGGRVERVSSFDVRLLCNSCRTVAHAEDALPAIR